MSRYALIVGAVTTGAFALFWSARTGPDDIDLLVKIERGRRQLLADAERFRDGDPAADMLGRVRSACAARRIVRLDDIEEARQRSAPIEESHRDGDGSLLDLDFARDGTGAMAAAERNRTLDPGARVLALSDEQVHTRATLDLARDDIALIEVEARATAPAFLLLGWSGDATVARMHRDKVRIDLRADGQVHRYSVDAGKALERGLGDGATLRRLFLSARSRSEAAVEVTRVRLVSKKQRFAATSSGVGYEEAGGQLRRCLWQQTQSALAYDVLVPGAAPTFETGIAVSGRDEPVEMELTLECEGASTSLLKRLVAPGTWQDVRVDLDRWRGRTVTLRLSARGLPGAVALWSSPAVRPGRDTSGAAPILLIVEDALRVDRLSIYGGPVQAPAHERLARAGTVFERAFAQAQQTRSSVPSLMTSLPPSATGTWDFSDSLRDEYVTLAEMLRECGYATASFLQNGNAGAYAGLHQGFDVVFDEKDNGIHASDLLGAGLRAWIAAHADRAFFAYVHILDPHGPFDPPARPSLPEAATGTPVRYDRALDPQWLSASSAEIRRVLYDAEIAANDAALGEFWSWLEQKGLFARSAIGLLADHGEYLGEGGGMWRHHPPGRLEVAHVPMLLAAPGLPQGKRESASVALLDVTPTLLDLAGIDASGSPMFGRSLAPMLRGDRPWSERALFVEEPGLERGERTGKECGSLLLGAAQLLLPCIGEQAFVTSPTPVAQASASTTAEPLRIVSLEREDFGQQRDAGAVMKILLEWRTRTLLRDLQATSIAGWRRVTGGTSAAIRSDARGNERLRALGYLQ